MTQAVQFSSVAFWGHVGGFATGAALTGLLSLIVPQLRERGEQAPVVRFVGGTVCDTTGKPIADARIEVHADFHPTVAATTDAKGRFGLPVVPDGTYSFRLTKAHVQPLVGMVVVRRKRRFPSKFNLIMSAEADRIAVADAQGVSA